MKWGYYYKEKVPPIEDFTDGAHIVILHKTNYYISNIIKLEDEGWEVRDCIKIQFQNESLQAGLLRKPFKGTVANNVIKNGCGGINIDACRISYGESGSIASNPLLRKKKGYSHKSGTDENSSNIKIKSEESQFQVNVKGRFPANLILECTCEEVIKGENHGVVINNKNSKNINDTIYKLGHSKGEQEAPRMYKDEGNTHTDENCPCYQLDVQSEIKKRGGHWGKCVTKGFGKFGNGGAKYEGVGAKDTTTHGASRYFYAFGDEEELKNYLISMINCDNV